MPVTTVLTFTSLSDLKLILCMAIIHKKHHQLLLRSCFHKFKHTHLSLNVSSTLKIHPFDLNEQHTHTHTHTVVSVSLAAVLWLLVLPLDVVKDVLLTVHQQRLSSHTWIRERGQLQSQSSSMQWCISVSLTGDAQWTDGVFVECEALLQSMGPHVLVEYITAGEVQHAAVILILRNKPADPERERNTYNQTKNIIFDIVFTSKTLSPGFRSKA